MKYSVTFNFVSMSVAAQMWNLAINLPLIIGNKVPFDDENWECFLVLLDILQLCTTRIGSSAQAGLTLRGPMSQICDVHVLHSPCRANKQKGFLPYSGYMTRVSIGIQGWFPPRSIKEITGNIILLA